MGPTSARHPDVDRWIAYRAGELAGDEEDTLQAHMVDCRDCTSALLDLDAFSQPANTTGVSDFDRAVAWRALQPRLEATRPGRRRWAVPVTLAASFLCAALGLGLWTATQESEALRQTVAELSRPQPNAPIHDLFPGAVERSARSAGTLLEIPAETSTFTLILNLVEVPQYAAYEVEFIDAEGRSVLEIADVGIDPLGLLTIGLSRPCYQPATTRSSSSAPPIRGGCRSRAIDWI